MEFVFVVPRAELFRDFYPQGLTLFGGDHPRSGFDEVVARHGFFVERAVAERTPTWKQVIPYSLIVREQQVFLLKRTKAGGEARLHDKLSIGVGGHIEPQDVDDARDAGALAGRNPVARGARREIDEELDIAGERSVRTLGTINDDSNPVGAVHIGLVQIVYVHGAVTVREQGILHGRFASVPELARLLREGANFETWSAKLVELLERSGADLLREPSAAHA